MKKSQIKKVLLFYIIISGIILFLSKTYVDKEEKKLLEDKYSRISIELKRTANNLIQDKKNATLAFAISTSDNPIITKALKENNPKILKFNDLSLKLREKTDFKNIWFQIVDKEGKNLYRSWTYLRDDILSFRPDIKNVLETKKTNATISVGRFDMTFKSIIPIFYKDSFIGIFEVITHFNSIHNSLKRQGIDTLIIADKRHFKKLKYPFTKKFIDKNYIANIDANENLLKLIKEQNINKIIKIKEYKVIKNKLITTFTINELKSKNIGYMILSKELKEIDIQHIKKYRTNALIFVLITIIGIGFILVFIIYNTHSNKINNLNKELKKTLRIFKKNETKKQQILDSQNNIILITNGKSLQNANSQLLKFFDNFKSFKDFKNKYECICQAFIDMDDENYVLDKDYDGKNWAEYILSNRDKKFRAAMKKGQIIHHFTLNVNLNQFEDEDVPYIIVTLTDISHEIKTQNKLQDLNENLELLVNIKTKELQQLNENLEKKVENEIKKSKEKDIILFRQNKMASMGEMLNNIAHQWRQPLNAITTAASSIILKSELESLEKKFLEESCDYILKHSNYLSQTIENFKTFFKEDEAKQHFMISDSIDQSIDIIKDKLSSNNIKLVLNIESKLSIFAYKNEFQQAILNIIENAIDLLTDRKNEYDRYLFIDFKENILTIKDNANGAKEEILEKIFEPYFTTKHQAQGTGIGLYMTQEILIKHMNCQITANNIHYTYEGKIQEGLIFKITF